MKTRREKITNEVHQGCHFKPRTPHRPFRLFSKPPFLEVSHLQLSTQHCSISNMASHRRSLNPPSSTTPTKVHPCEFYWHFRLDVGAACRDWGGLALPPLSPPSVLFTLPQPLSYTRNMINWCPDHPHPHPSAATTLTCAPSFVAIPQNNGNNKITSTVSSFSGTKNRYFYSDVSLHD